MSNENNIDVRDGINKGEYTPKRPYPGAKDPDGRKAYRQEQAALEEKFKQDLFKSNDVVGNPKAEKCFALAWDHGHSCGYHEVVNHFEEFVELIR